MKIIENMDFRLPEGYNLIVDNNSGKAGVSFLQRSLKVGYARATKMLEQMKEMELVSEDKNALVSKEDFSKFLSENEEKLTYSYDTRTETPEPPKEEEIPVEPPKKEIREPNFSKVSSSIDNIITIKNSSEEEVAKINQKISMHAPSEMEPLFHFYLDDTDGKGSHATLMNIVKNENDYSIALNHLSTYVTESGEKLSDVLGGEDALLKLSTPPSTMNISKKRDEICCEIIAESGKTYKITTDARTIKVEAEEMVYQCNPGKLLNKPTAINLDLNSNAIDEFLDKEKTFCKTPSKATDLPVELISLYGSMLQGNNQVSYGDCTITSISPAGDEAQPYIFLTKSATSRSGAKNYFLINGKLQSCDNFYLQYKDESGLIAPEIVLEVHPVSNDKSIKHYALPLSEHLEGKNLTEKELEAINFLQSISNNKTGDNSISIDDGHGNNVMFSKKDEKVIASDYDFKLSGTKYSIVDDSSMESEAEEEAVVEEVPIVEEEPIIEEEPVVEEPAPEEEPAVEDPASEEPPIEEHEDSNPDSSSYETFIDDGAPPLEKKKPKVTKTELKEVDYSKPTEAFGTTAMYIGLFLLAGAVLTGFGGLLIAGLICAGGGQLAVTGAGLMKFKPIRKTKEAIEEYEAQEFEDAKFVENVLSNEQEVDKAQGLAIQAEQKLAIELEGSALEDIYKEYSSEFAHLAEEDRLARFISQDGLEAKRAMRDDLASINSATDPEVRKQMVNNFITNHFVSLPEEDSTRLQEALSVENNEKLTKLESALTTAINSEDAFKKLHDAQSEKIGSASQTRLEKLIGCDRFNTEKRLNFVRRYAPAINRHFVNDDNLNANKLKSLMDKIPLDEREACVDILVDSSKELKSAVESIDKIADKNVAINKEIDKSNNYGQTVGDVVANPNSYGSKKELDIDALHFVRDLSYAKHRVDSPTKEATKQEIDLDSITLEGIDLTSMATPEDRTVLSGLQSLMGSFSEESDINEIRNSFFELASTLRTRAGEIGEFYSQDQGNNNTILPNNKNVKNTTTIDIVDVLKNLNHTEDQSTITAYEEAERNLFLNEIIALSSACESITDENYCGEIEVTEDEIKQEIKALNHQSKTRGQFVIVSEDVKRNIAIAKLKSEKIAKLELTDEVGISQQHQDIANSTIDCINGVIGGSYVRYIMDRAITGVLESENRRDGYTPHEPKASADALNESIKRYSKLKASCDKFDDKELIRDVEARAERGDITVAGAFKEVLEAKYGDEAFEDNAKTNKKIVEECTIDYRKEINSSPIFDKFENPGLVKIRMIEALERGEKLSDALESYIGSISSEADKKALKQVSKEVDKLSNYCERNGQVDLDKLKKIYQERTSIANNRAMMQTRSYTRVVGEKYGQKRLNSEKKDIQKGKKRVPKEYDSQLDMLIGEFGYSLLEDKVLDILVANPKISIAKLAEKLGVDKKAFEEKLDMVEMSVGKDELQKNLCLKQVELQGLKKYSQDFNEAWEEALSEGNITEIKDLLTKFKGTPFNPKDYEGDEKDIVTAYNKLHKKVLKKLGINLEELEEIINIADADIRNAKLQEIENKYKLLDRTKEDSTLIKDAEEEIEVLEEEIETTATIEDKKLYEAVENEISYQDKAKEFNAKLKVLLSLREKGYSSAEIDNAFAAFASGNTAYFENHPEIADLCEDFEFGAEDVELLKDLKINPKDLKKSGKKRLNKIFKMQNMIDKTLENNKKAVKKAEDETLKDGKDHSEDLTKEDPENVKKNVPLLSKLLEFVQKNVHKEAEEYANRNHNAESEHGAEHEADHHEEEHGEDAEDEHHAE